MSQVQLPVAGSAAPSDNSITVAAPQASAGRTGRKRCGVALILGTGQGFTQEVACLLRRRLLLAALITGTGFTVFFARHFVDGPHNPLANPLNHVFLGIVAAVQMAAAGLLASRVPLSVPRLRAVEVLLFGVAAAFFAWLQFDGLLHNVARHVAAEGHYEQVQRLANTSNSLRWFVLIITYGTFVPNTWRRCALVVGSLALLPFVINVAGSVVTGCPYMGACLGQSLSDTAIILGIGSAIAIFGSYKISTLHQEAFEARQLGQYQLKRRLGSGGMGEVYLGEHTLMRRPCAIKLIRPDQAGDPTTIQRFEREVKAMAALTHWNTVEVYDYGHTADGTFYYVMEYLPGLSLQDLVGRHGPLPPARAVHFLRQICAALGEAHDIGVIHRDIKPNNVIACTRGGVHDVAKLLDFGLVQCMGIAKADARLTVHGTILGSPPFMSPEQALGKDAFDARTDVYSVGALAYFLLTGQPPFVRDTAMQMLMAHVYEQVVPPSKLRPDVPADLEAVVLRCLEKDPAKRFPDAEALDEALAACACAGRWARQDAADWWHSTERAETAPAADGQPRNSYDGMVPAPALPTASVHDRVAP